MREMQRFGHGANYLCDNVNHHPAKDTERDINIIVLFQKDLNTRLTKLPALYSYAFRNTIH